MKKYEFLQLFKSQQLTKLSMKKHKVYRYYSCLLLVLFLINFSFDFSTLILEKGKNSLIIDSDYSVDKTQFINEFSSNEAAKEDHNNRTDTSKNEQVNLVSNSVISDPIQDSSFEKVQELNANSGWYDPRWRYRKNITVDSSYVIEDVSNFPILIKTFDSDLKLALNNGFDILFTDDVNNKLAHEIELFNKYYNDTHAYLVAWVKVDLSSTVDTTIMMYFGYPFANSQENAELVWTNNYQAVWHLKEKPSESILDSTANNYDGISQGGMTDDQLLNGIITDGLYFDGSTNSQQIVPNNIDTDMWNQITVEAWINQSSTGEDRIIGKETYGGFSPHAWTLGTKVKKVNVQMASDSSSITISSTARVEQLNRWYHLSFTWDGSNVRIYIDGNLDSTHSLSGTSVFDSTDDVRIASAGNYYNFHGVMDEVRVANSARTSGWITTQFNNQNNPDTFYTINQLEEYVLEGGWAFYSLDYRKNITIIADQFNISQNNFPILIDLTDKDLHDKAQLNGDDILFTDINGIKLEHEIEKFTQNYNSTHARLIAWVKIPTISNISDTIISMYYRNPEVTFYDNSYGLWNDYMGVWHLAELVNDELTTSNVHQDSSINTNNGDQIRNDDIAGQVYQGQDFDGVDDYIKIASPKNLDIYQETNYSISGWFYRDTTSTTDQLIAKRTSELSTDPGYSLWISNNDGLLYFEVSGGGMETGIYSKSNFSVLPSNWYFISLQFALVQDAVWKLYINGIDDGGVQYGANPKDIVNGINSLDFTIGAESDGDHPFDGKIDEIRIAQKSFSQNRILTEYNNQKLPQSFYSIGVELVRDVQAPIIQEFGVIDPGTGQSIYWANITDDKTGVASAFLEINNTAIQLNYDNDSFLWFYQQSVDFNDLYEYRILNASDYNININSNPTPFQNYTFNLTDTMIPSVDDWKYFNDIGSLGTFNANVSDSFGKIDSVFVNVTNREGITATLQPSPSGYINDTLDMASGTIYFTVTVNDTFGNSFTSPEHTGYVSGDNVKPIVQNIRFLPSIPRKNETLSVIYDYFDANGDPESSSTLIRWYKNGILQTQFNDQTSVSSSFLFRGDLWNVTVRPHDGKEYGSLNSSSTVVVANSAPSISSLTISPSTPTSESNINIEVSFTDLDGDIENVSFRKTQWYKNNVLQPDLNDTSVLSYLYTLKGEVWHYAVQVFDDTDYSEWYQSDNFTINNAAPQILNLGIINSNNSSLFTTIDDLFANWTYFDNDNDTIGFYIIRWFKNGILQTSFNDSSVIDSSNTAK
ncbi:MAG: DUF2341 domain-containing protein, partial [Candidatus Hodarchaeales archaeon]